MKNLIVSLLCFSFFLDVQGQQNLNVVSKISKVTVFQSQAQIEASTSVTLPAGRSVIVIEDIASTTDVNSIQVRGTGDFMILGTKFQRSLISTRQTKYTEQLNTITERIEEVDMLLNVAKAETSMIEKNAED
ncbi:MAG: glycerol-3-phosphate dehydrogenase, partial [Spirosomataceae bacterium]